MGILLRPRPLSLAVMLSLLAGCSSNTAPAPQQLAVAVTGASSTRLGGTTQFSAVVTGNANTAVVWQVNSVTGGSAASGTITTSGLYTAPATMPSAQSAVVTAISAASASASSSVTESLLNPTAALNSGTAVQVGTTLNYAVDLRGAGFVPSSVISAGGVAQATTLVSSSELQATVAVASGSTSLVVTVANPNPGATTSSALTLPLTFVGASATAAARILDQASYGPTATSIQHVQNIGVDAYITEQFATPTTLMATLPANNAPNLCMSTNSNPAWVCAESEWWQTVVTGNDQLRQRVAFALSEMFVISSQTVPGQGLPQYNNLLANDAFGNFRTIMQDVTLSPSMGLYLDMLNSNVPAAGQIANENFGRENMQLFTIGLNLLNQDGTLQLDSNGNPIPAYTEAQVQAFSRAYTGWTLANINGSNVGVFPNNSYDYYDQMVAVAGHHDTTAKTLLNGTVLPAGGTAQQDLTGALDNIFAHPNVGPFVCTQLIQHLVTSTPSAAYVGRVSAVFANNGNNVRGDMQAVIRAILTDTEARAGDTNASYNGGHLREPILFLTAMMRAFNFTNTDPIGNWVTLSNYSNNLNERPYRANSVFNFFPPDYVIPATTLNAPEFGNENSATVILRLTLADLITNNKISGFSVDFSNTSTLGVMAANPSALVSYLSMLLMHSQMPASMNTSIVNAITPLTSNAQRVRIAIYLIITSSQYKVIH